MGTRLRRRWCFSSSVQGQGRDEEPGAEVDGGDTSPEGGETLFIYIQTGWN